MREKRYLNLSELSFTVSNRIMTRKLNIDKVKHLMSRRIPYLINFIDPGA